MQYEMRRTATGDAEVYLNIDDLDLSMRQQIEPYLHFRVKTYQNLNKVDTEGIVFDVTFGQVNRLFNTMCKEDLVKIAMTMVSMHHDIVDFMDKGTNHQITDLTQRLGTMLGELDIEINLCAKIKYYVHENIPPGIRIPGSGKRAQDTEILTFSDSEIFDMLSIALLCKIMGPMFGQMIELCKVIIDGRLKEVHCATILTEIFREHRPYKLVNVTEELLAKNPWLEYHPINWHKIIVKFMNYISHNVKREFKENMTSIFANMTHSTNSQSIYAQLLVKNFVNVNLKFDKNIMTYVISTIKSIANSKAKTVTNTPVYHRVPMDESDGDENNSSQLEIDSIISSKMFDVPAIINVMVTRELKRLALMNENLTMRDYDDVTKFYTKHPCMPTTLNMFLNCFYYRRILAGAKSVLLLNSPMYTKITAYLQMQLFSEGYVELGHMITAMKSHVVKTIQSDDDGTLVITYKNSPSYRNCMDRFSKSPSGMAGNQWEVKMRELVDEFTLNHYVYHTAPTIWNSLGEENHNGTVIVSTPMLMESVSLFVEADTDYS